MPLAFTRDISPRLAEGELTHLARAPIDLHRAAEQHRAYEAALAAAGFAVIRLPPLPDLPDAVFVEDAAVILGRHALITRPGAASRRGETASAAEGLAAAGLTVSALDAGRLDGGDVIVIGRTIFVGLSARTDTVGIEALSVAAAPLGYAVAAVPLRDCLHLKTCASFAGRDGHGAPVLILDPRHVDAADFKEPTFVGSAPGSHSASEDITSADLQVVEVGPEEGLAANTLRAGSALLVAAETPRLSEALAARGFDLTPLDTGEFRKCEAALTCLSLIAEDV